MSLEKVFQELERQSNCSFLYNHRVVEARGRVSIQVVDKELSQVLDELLTKLGLGFTFDDNLVIIKERTSMWGKDSVQKGLRIVGRVVDEKKQAMPGVTVYHAGTALGDDGVLRTAGGRVLNVTALGPTFEEARARAYAACDAISFDGKTMRLDIGERALRGRAAWEE